MPHERERKVKEVVFLHYSRPEIQEAIFKFSENREIVPSYMMERFGKRPDSFQYKGDIFELVKKGATSFHCSEELWRNPLDISTGMAKDKMNGLRIGWDLIIDIDSKYLDYSKILALQIIKILNFHGVRNFGIKFSGSKGFHLIVPWKAFPKEVNGIKTSDMFPEWPRIVLEYITEKTKPLLVKEITRLTTENKYVLDTDSSREVIPDIVLVSSRHLFRAPYSLHEKTALASAVLTEGELKNFQPKDASPFSIKIREFIPNSKEGEASELLTSALDWHKETGMDESTQEEKKTDDFKPVRIENLSEANFPPTIQKILQGVEDGRKRSLFILLNFFRAIGLERGELEKKVYDWNKKNKSPLKEGYVKTQILWSYRNKVVPPPNFTKDYYRGIGIVPTEEEMRYKNPVSYVVKKSLRKKEGDGKRAKRPS
jgi:hypothetical protein